MKQRGRKSAAKLAVIAESIDKRPIAPKELTAKEKRLFDEIVASRVNTFFDVATLPLLCEYCRMYTTVEKMAVEINAFDEAWLSTDEGLKRYDLLERIRDRAQARLMMTATKLRLTNQSRYAPDKAATRPKTAQSKVWQRES